MQEIAKKHAAKASFLTIYIKEAHPTDEWQMSSNEKEGVCYAQPKTVEDRLTIARDFVTRTKWEIPLLVDSMANVADEHYAGWPERIYVIGIDGKIAVKGGLGPFEFDPEEADRWLDAH